MNRLFLCTALLSVLALASSALIGDNRYGAPHGGNSLSHRSGYGHPGAPRAPSRPALPSRPAAPAFGGHRNYPAPAAGHYAQSAPSHFSAPASAYGGHSSYGAPAHVSGPSHYGPKRSVYQPQQQQSRLASNNYPQQSSYQQHSESKSQSHGREMKYTINDPHNRGTTHVTETHVVTNRQMHGAEAEAAMKKLMGSMGPGPSYGSDGGFQDFVKGMGLPNFY